MISSECVPFAKTGGLADVVGALPKALRKLGHEVIVVLPLYGSIDYRKHGIELFIAPIGVRMGNSLEWCAVHKAICDGVISVYFIEYDKYFQRDGLYHDAWFNDYADNPKRFAFFSRAALQLLCDMNWAPDVVHAHDWQAALAMAYLKIGYENDPFLADAAGLLTIHNIAYQGIYGSEHLDYTGLNRENFRPEIFEDHGRINYLKGGIYFADMVNTVSPTYARETRSGPLSCGMAPSLNNKGDRYTGVLNGVDYAHWSPESDRYLPVKYSAQEMDGKKAAKKRLQETFHLTVDEEIPIIGVVSRFVAQKGLDVFAQVVEPILREMAVQFAVLGSGDKGLEHYYGMLPGRYPGKVGSHIGYSDELSHLIEGGSDFFLMPSQYEPCGLNQIYSLKYGTLPIVRATGGLDDTVEQYDEKAGSGNGFKFYVLSPTAIYYTVGWAVSTWYDRPAHITAMRRAAMAKDFSWETSAKQYVALYERAIAGFTGAGI
ncbi:MAG: glycogen synthase GlgA [Proteobacteria bacterium]|nr:glycogen synthase GlgA [Pseudomonadota bacterium]